MFFVYLVFMDTIPLGELNHNPARVTARVRSGATVILTEHGKPVIRMVPANEPASALDRLAAEGKVRRSAHPGAMPEPIEDLAGLPSLSELLIAERDAERGR